MVRSSKPRIVLCGTGYFGCQLARIALEKGYHIVAAVNRAGSKVGQDLGRLAGLERDLGIIVQDDESADYAAFDADIGVVTQTNVLAWNMPTYRRLLGAGLNVLCHGTEAYYPIGNNPALAREIDSLAKANNVTFTGSGIWDMSRIWAGILLVGPCSQIDSVLHRSATDVIRQGTPTQLREVGIACSVDEYMAKGIDKDTLWPTYATVPEHVLAAVGYTISGKTYTVSPIVFEEDLDSPYLGCTVPAGDVVGTRLVADIETREGVTGRIEFEGRLFRPGETETMFWSVEGKPRNRVATERLDSGYTTVSSLFGRIAQVIDAPSGNVLLSQLGPLRHTALL